MTVRIGKLALILGVIVNLLIFFVGILYDFELLPKVSLNNLYYPFLMCIPLVSSLLCLLLGWIFVKVSKKEAKPTENNIAVFFKSHLYVWMLVSGLILIFGFVSLDFRVDSPRVILVCTALNGVAWISTVIVCILIWAAFNAWKNSEVVGVIIALIALIILVGSLTIIGLLYAEGKNHAKYHSDYSSDYGEYDMPAEEVYEVVYPDDYYYEDGGYDWDYDYNSEDKYDLAYRFLKYRLDLNNPSRPADLLMCWKNYSWRAESEWGEEQYIEKLSDFEDSEDFYKCKNYFYYVYDECSQDNDKIASLSGHYLNDWDMGIDKYKKSGAQACVKLLLLAHDDIYSNSNSDEILGKIYNVMSESEEFEDLVSDTYPKLAAYMSSKTLEKMKELETNCDTQWCNDLLSGWAYSFWARRHNSGVDKGAYKVLKAIDKFYK